MQRLIPQVAFLVIIAAVFGVARNEVVSGGIDWVGDWDQRDSVIEAMKENPEALPPSAEADDPPMLSLSQAVEKFDTGKAIFVDARMPEEYDAEHIKGAIRLPFEYFDEYWPFVEDDLADKSADIVTYCNGAECELSLFLARHLESMGYTNVSIFFGGWTQWQENGGPTESGEPDAQQKS